MWPNMNSIYIINGKIQIAYMYECAMRYELYLEMLGGNIIAALWL